MKKRIAWGERKSGSVAIKADMWEKVQFQAKESWKGCSVSGCVRWLLRGAKDTGESDRRNSREKELGIKKQIAWSERKKHFQLWQNITEEKQAGTMLSSTALYAARPSPSPQKTAFFGVREKAECAAAKVAMWEETLFRM